MRRQLAAGNLFLNAKPGLIGQSKTDRVRVIGNALSDVVTPRWSSNFAFANAHAMFALANGKPRSSASTQVDAANFKFAACAREGVTCQINQVQSTSVRFHDLSMYSELIVYID